MGFKRKASIWFGGLAIASLLLVLLVHSLAPDPNQSHRRCKGDLRTVIWIGKDMEGANCSGQLFREADLSEARFRRAKLRGNDFSGGATRLIDTDFRDADLTGADFQGAQATRANFSGAILRDADLRGAELNGARFQGADLQGAKFNEAQLIAADLTDLKHPPSNLDRANLKDAKLGFAPKQVRRFCNAILPDGEISKQGCFALSDDLKRESVYLQEFRFSGIENTKNWRWLEVSTTSWLGEAVVPTEIVKRGEGQQGITPQQIQSVPCTALKELDQLWRQVSGDRFGLSIQRRIWESPQVKQNYNKFGEVVGWKQQGQWLKFDQLSFVETETGSKRLPTGFLPWHQWQVQEPTPEQPTRFRRTGFGDWMARLKACGI